VDPGHKQTTFSASVVYERLVLHVPLDTPTGFPTKFMCVFLSPSEFHDQAIITSITYVHTVNDPRFVIFSVLHLLYRDEFPPHLDFIYFFVAQQPSSGLGRLPVDVSRSHTITHRHIYARAHAQPVGTPLNERSARRRGRLTTQHTTSTRDEEPRPQRDSNLQSQQSSDRRSMP
jgi:hypothetical protein